MKRDREGCTKARRRREFALDYIIMLINLFLSVYSCWLLQQPKLILININKLIRIFSGMLVL